MNNFLLLFFITKLIVLFVFRDFLELLFVSNAIHSFLLFFYFSRKISFKRSHKLIAFSIDSTLPFFGVLIIYLFNLLYKYKIFEQKGSSQKKHLIVEEKQKYDFLVKKIMFSSNKSKLELIKQLSAKPNYENIRIIMLALNDISNEIKKFAKSSLIKIRKDIVSTTFEDKTKQINHYMFLFECKFIDTKNNFDIYQKCLNYFLHEFKFDNNNIYTLKSLSDLYLLNNDYENHIKFNNFLLNANNEYKLYLNNARAFFKLKDFNSLKSSLTKYKMHASIQEQEGQKDILDWWLQNE